MGGVRDVWQKRKRDVYELQQIFFTTIGAIERSKDWRRRKEDGVVRREEWARD
jgi:hypothetical protein